ncbi:sulfur carrier protein ThiS adenylyltransferase ThiF [Desulfovibrio sp.]|uniref:sulfur carrier protein ThiS adenylyltransferase ThiF n=1 Tax=Desulfovibrio sp. TaxID=885 RepID=UPI0023BB6D17|nr:sulfur carrier protein ThiS adenylyltransferase ThiF [Desulfovibrio sp.]MDE7240678.1 sulfur carrier protein ThiS adenylyltransferase ThiF [Desulfovibrio sp.]
MSGREAREAGGQSDALREGLARYFTPDELARLRAARVGIAGAGGLGSNVALMLARSGVEDMLIVDHDVVDASNLNRQQFWPRHVGRPKVEALGELLRELNPHIRLELVKARLDEATLPGLLPSCPIWVEALDAADTKTLLVERALTSGRRIASASGVAGVGGAPMRRRRLGNLVLVGDFETDVADAPPLAPRVTQAAALLADAVLEFILG